LHFALEADRVLDFLVFGEHDRVIEIALSVNISKDLERLLPAVLGCEPTGRPGEPEETNEKDEGRDHLNGPGDTEGGGRLFRVFGTTTVEG
jgi:hypothetical protein